MDERERRIGLNEALFREVNVRLDEVNEAFSSFTGTMSIVCECGDATCIEQISIAEREYQAVRAEPADFVIVRGHEAPDVEAVVDDRNGYVVVRKRPGDPARLARETDPRGDG